MHFDKQNIRLKFGCKIPSMKKVIAFYSKPTEAKVACLATISPMRWEQNPVARFIN